MVKKKEVYGILISLGILILLFFYISNNTGYGAKFSCENGVLGVSKVPMPPLSVVPSIMCKASAKFYVNDILICDLKNETIDIQGYIHCDELEDYSGENVLIKAIISNLEGNDTFIDEKIFIIE